MAQGYFYPVPGGTYERVDQGVDYKWSPGIGSDVALASGTITKVGSFGAFQGVYEQFDYPIPWRGQTYPGAYYAEGTPLVGEGHVAAGTPLMSGEYTEVGFLNPGMTVPKLRGTLGAGTLPSPEGWAFKSFIESISLHSPLTPTPPTGGKTATGSDPCGGCPAGEQCIGTPDFFGQSVKFSCQTDAHVASAKPLTAGSSGPAAAVSAVTGALSHGTFCGIPCLGLRTGTDSAGNPSSSICDGGCWLRVFEIIGGAILLLVGIILLGRQLATPTSFRVAMQQAGEETAGVVSAPARAVGGVHREAGRQTHRRAAGITHERMVKANLRTGDNPVMVG